MAPVRNAIGRAVLFALFIFYSDYARADNTPFASFASPPHAARPKFRYWLPDASVSPAALDADIASLAAIGAGGLELLPFFNYGQPPISTDWSVYGFGTPAFAALFQAALNATAVHGKADNEGEKGMVLDFALGANQAAGVPSPPPPASARNATEYLQDGRGLSIELVYGAVPLPTNSSVVTVPPPDIHFNYESLQNFINAPELWGDSQLVAVLAVEVTGEKSIRGGRTVFLNESSVVDLTDRVRNGTVPLDSVPSDGSSPWQLMAFYQRYTNERSCVSVANASSWVGNGSWMVDHFSAAGAQKMTDFWDTHLLADNATRQLLAQVGGYSWEDSMEMMAALWWTPEFLESFRKRRGYSVVRVLPVLFQAANLWNGYGPPYNTTYTFGQDSAELHGGRYAEDYRLTLNEGYQAYLAHYQAWAHDKYGLDHSCQPAYNLPLDMAADVPLVGAPELESLGFDKSIANYLQFTGAAHLAGRNTVSTEIGAQRIGAYAQTVPALLKLFRDSFAAGVNTLVIHGFPYSGPYPGTTWPGYTPFQFEFGEMWGPRQPAWRHLNDTLRFAARNSFVLKTGVSRVDLAFYTWEVPFSARQQHAGPDELNAAGYTHEYIGGENLVSAVANGSRTGGVRDGVLGPDGPAYKALVIIDQERISPAASAALLTLAAARLPIIVVQAPPNTTIGMFGQANVTINMAHLLNGSFSSVKTVSHAGITANMLAAGGIAPRVRVDAVAAVQPSTNAATNASQLYTHWRADVNSEKEFVYLLNRGPAATFTLAFEIAQKQAVPYVLDTWTGTQSPLLVYARSTTDGRLVANVTLSQEQSAIFAFAVDNKTAQFSIVSHSPNIVNIGRGQDSRLDVLIQGGAPASLQLSNGTIVAIPSLASAGNPNSSIANLSLGPWHLSVETDAAPDVLTTASVAANKTTLAVPTFLTTLVPWTQIHGLERVSGVGTYTTTFSLNATSTDDDFVFTLQLIGPVLHTLRAFVNGIAVPAFDSAATVGDRGLAFANGRDISSLLRTDGGQNTLRIEVASSLFNAIKVRQAELRSVGLGTRVPRYYTEGDWARFGLVGEVVVKSWRRVRL